MAALQKLSLTSFGTTAPAARRDRRRSLRDLLGGLLILAVWLFLWSWITVGVLAPLGRTDLDRRPHAVAALRA